MQYQASKRSIALQIAARTGAAAAFLAFALLVLTTLAAFLPVPWPYALAEHGKPQLAVGGGGFALMMLVLRKWRIGAASLLCVAANYAAMVAVPFISPGPAEPGAHEIRVVWSNVAGRMDPLRNSLAYAREMNADILLVGEYPPDKELSDLAAPDYPFHADTRSIPAADAYRDTRITVLSRLPIANARIIIPGDASGRPFLAFDLQTSESGQTIHVVSAHVLFPMKAFSHAAQPDFISAMAAELTEPFLIAGDLNATPWSRAYALLPGKRIGDPKWQTTYSGRRAWPPTMSGMPIDHVMVSSGISASAYETGPDTGSNHRPLFAAIHVKD